MNNVSKPFQLIGTEVSLYTGKVRAYLRYKNIPYEEVLSTAEVYKNIIIPRTGVRFIPIIITDDDQAIQDSTEIIDYCENRFPDLTIYPESPNQRLVSLLLEIYGDEWLVNPAMHYRWSFDTNREFAFREFGRTSAPHLSIEEQQLLGKKLSEPFAGALPRLGISQETIPAIEKSYLNLLSDLNNHFQHYPYLMGYKPSIADYGFIGPLYAHLYRDPYSGELMQEHAPNLVNWVLRVHEGESSSGEYLDNDQVPITLLPVLSRMFKEQVPVLLSTVKHLQQWVKENDEIEIPRAIGKHSYKIGDAVGERLIMPYNLWMWQRAVDCYQQVDGSARETINQFFAPIPNAIDALNNPLPNRLIRKNNKLQLA